MGDKILVTGADGFIGSHLVERLAGDGHEVRAFVLYNSFGSAGWLDTIDPAYLEGVGIFPGDIRDAGRVEAAVVGCTRVLHLAALISIPYSYDAPQSYVDTNISGTLNVLAAARGADTPKTMITSTSEVYGTARSVPITEDHSLNAQSPYAATKTAADQLALSFFRSFDLPLTIVRPFNTYGPRQSTRAVLPTIITQLTAGRAKIELGATHPTRDFSYVRDTVAGMVAASDPNVALGETINLGSDFEISIADAAGLIGELMGIDPEIVTKSDRLRPRDSEVERLWADNTRARNLLDWTPSYGGLDGLKEGLKETIEWYRDPQNLKWFRADRLAV